MKYDILLRVSPIVYLIDHRLRSHSEIKFYLILFTFFLFTEYS